MPPDKFWNQNGRADGRGGKGDVDILFDGCVLLAGSGFQIFALEQGVQVTDFSLG